MASQMPFIEPKVYYEPDVPGIRFLSEDRWMKFGKGYHCPIVLGQVLNSRYRVLSLVGWGGYALVWLAVDQHHSSSPSLTPSPPKYVALKVFGGAEKPSGSFSSNEETFLRRLLSGRDRESPGRRNIIDMFDAFDIESANGIHRCLVLELAGWDFALLTELNFYGPDDSLYIFKQCVETIEYLHSLEICHGDLDLANYVFALPDYSHVAESDLIRMLSHDPTKEGQPVKMKDGSPLPAGVPDRVWEMSHFDVWRMEFDYIQVRLIDFGESFTGTKSNVHTHTRNTPPELVEQGVASSASDIWALGCILWHLLGGHPLMFDFSESDNKDPYSGQKRFMSMAREERRAWMADTLPDVLDVPKDNEYVVAITEILMDTLEPNPSDRPSADKLLSYPIFALLERDMEISDSPPMGEGREHEVGDDGDRKAEARVETSLGNDENGQHCINKLHSGPPGGDQDVEGADDGKEQDKAQMVPCPDSVQHGQIRVEAQDSGPAEEGRNAGDVGLGELQNEARDGPLSLDTVQHGQTLIKMQDSGPTEERQKVGEAGYGELQNKARDGPSSPDAGEHIH